MSDPDPNVAVMNYWVNTVSRDHVQRGVAGGFTQANHGKPNLLRRMARGDWLVFYSPKTHYPEGEPLQAFTAIGQVSDDEPYQAEMAPDFYPWRRNVGDDDGGGDGSGGTSSSWRAPRRPSARSSMTSTSSRTSRAGDTGSGSGFSRSTSMTSPSSAPP